MPDPTPPLSAALPRPSPLRQRFDELRGERNALANQREYTTRRLDELGQYLALAPKVDEALEALSHELFGKLADVIQRQLTFALQEVLAQPISLKVTRDFKRGAATMGFYIERGGEGEDILRGQGGSVANILSVGLRIFALWQLDEKRHRRFLVLDEQDCWLAPELVPLLVRIVRDAGRAMGFQVIMISHHSTASFEPYADRIYRFVPTAAGITVERVGGPPQQADP